MKKKKSSSRRKTTSAKKRVVARRKPAKKKSRRLSGVGTIRSDFANSTYGLNKDFSEIVYEERNSDKAKAYTKKKSKNGYTQKKTKCETIQIRISRDKKGRFKKC